MPLHEELEHYTIADYTQWGGDWELIRGRPQAMTPSPGISHQLVSGNLFRQFHEQLEDCPQCLVLYETDWELAEDTVVRPDIMVLRGEVGERVTRRPELIVEVVSQASARRDERIKPRLYAEEGVPFYLLVYPEREVVKAYHLRDSEYRKEGDFFDEPHRFALSKCTLDLDFANIWPY